MNCQGKDIGLRLRRERRRREITQGKLGGLIGVSAQQVSKYEKGTNEISAITLNRAAHALDVSLLVLLPPMAVDPAE